MLYFVGVLHAFLWLNIFRCWVDHNLCIHSTVSGHLGALPLGESVARAAVDTDPQQSHFIDEDTETERGHTTWALLAPRCLLASCLRGPGGGNAHGEFVSGEGARGLEAGLPDQSVGLTPSGENGGNLFKSEPQSPQETKDKSVRSCIWRRGEEGRARAKRSWWEEALCTVGGAEVPGSGARGAEGTN